MSATPVRSARDIPRAGGRLSLLRDLSRHPLRTATRLRRAHGPLVLLPIPGLRVYLLSDPAAIHEALTLTNRVYGKGLPRRRDPTGKPLRPLARILGDGLLVSDGALWRRQRRVINPLFHRDRIAGYASTFASLADAATERWVDGRRRDVHEDMTELTLAIVARTVLDLDLRGSGLAEHIRRSLAANQAAAKRRVTPWGRLADALPLPSTRRLDTDLKTLNTMVYRAIARRRTGGTAASGETVGTRCRAVAGASAADLLRLLLDARDPRTGAPMPDRLVRDETVGMLLAGHETTASTLAWALYLLGTHEAVQRRLHAELDAVLGGGPGGRAPRAEDLSELPYTRAVLRETLRLYPPAWLFARRLLRPRDVCGYRLPAGSLLVFSPWVVQRDPDWWPDPDSFVPERWQHDGTPTVHDGARTVHGGAPGTYFPFGAGPRQCIGHAFADVETVIVLAAVCRRWAVRAMPGTRVEPAALVTLRPREGVPVTVHRRRSPSG